MEFSPLPILLYICGIVLVLLLGVVGAFIYQIMGSRFQRPHIILQQREDLPAYLLKLYQGAFDQLSELGFTPHHFQLSQDIVAHERAEKWCMIMVNRATGVFAEIGPASTFLDMPGYEADFWSVAKDGTALLTYNGRGHTIFGEIPGVRVHDPLQNSLLEQYKTHLNEQMVFRQDKQLTLLNPATYVKLQQKLMDGYFLKLIKDGALISIGHNQFRLTLGKALKLIGQLIKGEAKVGKLARAKYLLQMRAKQGQADKQSNTASQAVNSPSAKTTSAKTPAVNQPNSDVSSNVEFPVEAEVAAYMRLKSVQEYNSVGVMGKMIMFILTVILSYFAFGLVFSFNSVLILMAVIFFHELGHIAAMYLFRYRDLQILFIPLLGAAATGKKENVAVWKQVMVYLSGPLPGIIIGIVLIFFNKTWQAPLVYETSIMLLVINYLNLLPFVPLDGGHIVRLTIMERFPTGKLVFTAISGLAFLLGGFYLSEPVFWVLAIIMLASLPMSKLETRVLKELYSSRNSAANKKSDNTANSVTSVEEVDSLDVQGKITRVFETLRKPQFSKLNFSDKFNLVRSLSEVILQQRHCKLPTTLSLSGLYLGALLLTPPAVLVTAVGVDNASDTIAVMTDEIPVKDWDREIAKETDLDKRFEITMSAAQFYSASNNLPLSLSYLQQAEADANTLNKSDKFARLYHAYSFYYQQLGDMDQAEQALKKAIDIGMKASDKNHVQLATHFQSLASLKQKQGDLKEYESDLLTALLFAKQIEKPSERFMIANILDQLIELFTRQKQYNTGIILLQQTISELGETDDPAHKYIVRYAYQELGWLYERSGESKTALDNFNRALILMPTNKTKKGVVTVDNGNVFGDPMEKVNLLLAMASIQNKYSNFLTAQTLIENAETIAKENYFSSLDQYIESFLTDTEVPAATSEDRMLDRWHTIADAYQNILKHKTEADAG